MNSNTQDTIQKFLAQASRYLFGSTENAENFLRLGFPKLQPIPVRAQDRR